MKYYLSLDSGGTKTAFLITDENGTVIGKQVIGGCTYSTMGSEKIYRLLREGAYQILKEYQIRKEEFKYVVWGISCLGEYKDFDIYMKRILPELFDCECYLCNDVEIGLAGSLLLQSGIHIIAGTGAIIMGKNKEGETARANGWHESFSDEGSGHWLGMKTLSLFTRQADYREKRSFLYALFYQYLELKEDTDIISYYQEHLEGRRDSVAALQKILLEAAKQGDSSAVKLYEEAAKELATSVAGVAKQLNLKGEQVKVSYYGGVFKADYFIKEPLARYLDRYSFQLYDPILSPLSGGILIAADKCQAEKKDSIIENLKRYEGGMV